MIDYQIGNIVGVSGDGISIALSNQSSGPPCESGVPDSMVVTLSTTKGPRDVIVGQPGSFVGVALPDRWLLCMVVDSEAVRNRESDDKDQPSGGSAIRSGQKLLGTIPIGTFSDTLPFESGTDILPALNAPVFAVGPDLIEQCYASHAKGDFTLGTLSMLPDQPARIDLDAFLTRHAAILGMSGAGKSWAVASFVQKLCAFERGATVLFDLHGEYAGTFGEDAEVISGNDLELPYWLMNSEELIDFLMETRDASAGNQIGKFKELLQFAKTKSSENQALGLSKITVDTPVQFDLLFILKEIRRLNSEVVLTDKGPKPGPLQGAFTEFLVRIDSRMNDRRYDFIFSPKVFTSSASMADLIRQLLGRSESSEKKVVVFDLSPVPFEARNLVIAIIMRSLFEFAYWFRRVYDEQFPIAIFADEAHLYLQDRDKDAAPARRAAERIVKEGRKYGISLTVISQRPREVSAAILSQCNTFLCLRLSHPDDQSYIRNLLPDSVRGLVQLLATLRRGEGILLGDSVLMPTRLRLDPPNPPPSSHDASFQESWSRPTEEINFTRVLKIWRDQGA